MCEAGPKLDLSQYCESQSDDDYAIELDLPKGGLVCRDPGTALVDGKLPPSSLDDSESLDDFFASCDAGDVQRQASASHQIDNFFSSYKGPGSVTRLSGSRRKVSAERIDWHEDFELPNSGVLSLKPPPRFEENNAFFATDPLPPHPPSSLTSDHLSSVSLLDETSLEEDFQFPDSEGFSLRLSSPITDVPLELDVDGEKESDPTPLILPQIRKGLSTYSHEDAGENWDDLVIPRHVTQLNVTPRKPYRTIRKEENWLEDLVVPNDSIFSLKVEQNKFLKRKPTPLTRGLKRNTLQLGSPVSDSGLQNSFYRPYACRALRHKPSGDSFLKKQLTLKETLSNLAPLKQASSPTSFNPSPSLFYQTKHRYYGDGTELDDFDNLPVPVAPRSRHKNKIQRLNPPKAPPEAPEEHFSQFLNQFSEIEVKRGIHHSQNKPHLIRNLNSLKVERTVNGMKFNPQSQTWEGNEEVLKDFEPSSPPRPALITNLNGNKRSQRVGDMVFDPLQMRWYSVVDEEDPLADIPDLIASDPIPAGTRPGFAPGDSFHLTPSYLDSLYTAERQHRQFMAQWHFTTPSPASRGVGYDHLFDIRNFPPDM